MIMFSSRSMQNDGRQNGSRSLPRGRPRRVEPLQRREKVGVRHARAEVRPALRAAAAARRTPRARQRSSVRPVARSRLSRSSSTCCRSPPSSMPPISRYSSTAAVDLPAAAARGERSTISVSSLACCASSIQWWRSRLLNWGRARRRPARPRPSAAASSTRSAGSPAPPRAAGGASTARATSVAAADRRGTACRSRASNSSRKRLKRWMCFASSPANPSSARTRRVVAVELRPRVVEDEGQDELLHQAEDVEVGVAADLVERAPLVGRQEGRAARRAPAPPA